MMIFFTLLLFYVNGALVEDEFDSDNFEDFYTVIPVLSEIKYPEMSWGKSFKRHIKLNETKEAFQSETTKIVFDLLKKLNLSVDNNLVTNLMSLGNKFNMNITIPDLVFKKSEIEPGLVKTDSKVSNATTQHDADDYTSVVTETTSFNSSQTVTCVTVIKKDQTIKNTQIRTKKPKQIANKVKIVQVPGIWFNGQCRCNYIFRSGSYTINPNLYFIIFFDILSCVFGK